MKTLRVMAAVAVAFAALFAAAPAHADNHTASVSVLHGIPGATVDVWANGEPLLTDFQPGTLTDPVMLEAGDYDLKVVAAGDPADATAIVEANGVTVPAGANITVVAHLSADGQPTLTPFANDTSKLDAGMARLTVRHTAAAPAVDVRANGAVALADLTNPNAATAVVAAGSISADVVLAGTDTVAIGPADLDLAESKNTIVYAWGSAADDNLQLAVQVVDAMHSSPEGVPAGNGGQAAASDLASQGGIAAGAALLAGGLVWAATRRRVNA